VITQNTDEPVNDERPQGHVDAAERDARRDQRRPGELTPREMLRWAWRQLTSMRTALVLLLPSRSRRSPAP
jgi:hypothetical protein